MNNKARQRHEVVMEFGILIQPIVDLVVANTPPAINQYRVAAAKVQAGDGMWRGSVRKLASFGPDILMNAEFQKISHTVERFLRNINNLISDAAKSNDTDKLQTVCKNEVDRTKEDFYECLAEIPVEWEPEIFPANTPFTAYMKIKDAILTASSRVHYFDRYLPTNFFDLFLRDIERNIELRLVTTKSGISNVREVSEIAMKEFDNYQLIEVDPSKLHDRNLIIDTSVFSLGPSIDRAGFAPTNFGPSENSDAAQSELAQILLVGKIVHQS
ncbi:MAG: hypothetical protein NPIRA01_09670 [Nitrospirales bacterium]|nr:MAG: hypothetical protein NPIRA01_09670 [Nitrospirales bacterium]